MTATDLVIWNGWIQTRAGTQNSSYNTWYNRKEYIKAASRVLYTDSK